MSRSIDLAARSRRVAPAGLAYALAVCGCMAPPPAAVHPPAPARAASSDEPSARQLGRDQRERSMRDAWIGRARSDLVAHFGPPALVAGVPGPRQPAVMLLVYQGLDARGGCVDAFIVQAGAGQTVTDYICR